MKRAPISYRRSSWSKEKLARWRQIERDFHGRAFGEELARVNLDLTIEERHRYLDWMRELLYFVVSIAAFSFNRLARSRPMRQYLIDGYSGKTRSSDRGRLPIGRVAQRNPARVSRRDRV